MNTRCISLRDDFRIGLVISLRVAVLAFDDFCIGQVISF